MKKYLVCVKFLTDHGLFITSLPLEFEEITILNISDLKNDCLNHPEINFNFNDMTILGWSEFAD